MLDVDASFDSFPEYAREYHVKLVAFAVEVAGLFDQWGLGGSDQAQKVFGLLGLFDTTADGEPEWDVAA